VFALAAAAHNSPFPQLFSCPSQFLHLVSLTPLTCVCVCSCCCCSQLPLSTAVLLSIPIFASCKPYAPHLRLRCLRLCLRLLLLLFTTPPFYS
jgi:hypothetical protein